MLPTMILLQLLMWTITGGLALVLVLLDAIMTVVVVFGNSGLVRSLFFLDWLLLLRS